MDARAFLDGLLTAPANAGAEVHIRILPARAPQVGELPEDLPPVVRERLQLLGIEGLYPHQREAFDFVDGGAHVIAATGTASGKTLVYNLAFAKAVMEDSKATALYLYPTKALARDQLRQVRSLKLPQIRAAVYDGDTPREERGLIRKNANLVLSNPDMLHLSFLPDHARWADFFLRLRYVVVDEAHVARGMFGSHVSMVLRRLRRLVAHYGGDPQFVLASATIGNPEELAERLTGVSFQSVAEDASPTGEKVFALWNPPVIDELSGARRSPLTDSSSIVASLVDNGVRTIAFARSRRAAELLADFARRSLPAIDRGRVKAYRAGYLPEERRALELALASGELLAICSTTALELGIDVGALDAAVLAGYPGTRASMWQQAGRAGRTTESSLAILVAQDDPLDQYLVTHPGDLFDQPPEDAVIDPTNPFVLGPHLLCAARELPLAVGELSYFGSSDVLAPVVAALEEGEDLVRKGELLHHRGRTDPHREVDIRSGGGAIYAIVMADTGELLGTIDEARAFAQVHPGAIYLHQGEAFEVEALDLDQHIALVSPSEADFFTQSRDVTDLHIEQVLHSATTGEAPTFYGRVTVSREVTGFVRRSVATGQVIDTEPLDLPAQALSTTAVWWQLPKGLLGRAALTASQVPGAAHAAEHAAIGLLPLIATCDRWDIGGVSTPMHPDTGEATIFVYDGYAGGAGIAERGFAHAERWLRATAETVANCPCSTGCPACVVSPKCGNGNEPLDKAGAISLLRAILGLAWG